MLAINNLSYYIGSRPIYEEASLHIKPKDKIGLIGLNGTGKTTLLRLINGDYTADGGEITKSNDCSIGYLNQDLLSFQSDDSILHVAMQAFEEALKIEQQIEKVLKQMETDYDDSLVEKLSKLQEKYEMMEGYSLQAKAEELLEGIGFTTEDLQRPLREFSGGWRMRVMLAKLLLEKPSLLMLDEPTNHLDLPSIQWIENYLRNYEGAVIIVSHDRQFLDNTINMIVEVSNQQLNVYAGNYSFYLEERELRREIQQNAYENQQQKIKQTERFIERFRAKATKARQVQSRVKALERMDKVDEVVDENAAVNFRFSFKKHSGRFVVEMNDVSKAYGDLQVIKDSTRAIERGDKIALIGANGKGKSTLLRIIAGSEPVAGESKLGYNVEMGFFAQHQLEALNIGNDMLTELKQAGSEKTEQELRGVLGCFLFSDDEVFKKIKVLSGGEKSRVALAKTLIGEANFLLLDEPTNHLDMQSVNILIQALQQYQGTFVIVSHDRYFISQVANKIWYIEDREVKEYPGTYSEYDVWQRQRQEAKATQQAVADEVKKEKEEKPKPRPQQEDQQANREKQKQIKKLQSELVKAEKEVMRLEKQKESLEKELAKPSVYGNVELLAENTDKFEQVEKELHEATQNWEMVALQVEELEQEMS
jgi:ATP-binding cassette, subfamily F, member 3